MDQSNPRAAGRPEDQEYGRSWEQPSGYPPTVLQHVPSQPDYAPYAFGPPPHPPPNIAFNPPPPHQLFSQMPPWPSMLSNPSLYPPQQGAMPRPVPRTRHSGSGQGNAPRKMLTDEDRKRMCRYHLDHPNTKQTEIGALFGVERSTVSKVLRQKDKYLFPGDRSRSPVKRTKPKFPDIEKGLSNWAKSTQSKGASITDEMISEKADFFARSLGYIDSVDKMKTSSWIRKFKQKHSVGSRRGYDEIAVGGEGNSLEMHDSNDSSEPRTSGHLSAGEFNENISPSMTRPYDMIKANSPESYGSGPYNKSAIGPGATPVSSTFSSDNPSYYSSTSPHSAFYSPDPQSTPNPFLTPPLHRLPPISDQLQGQLPPRPRSQTFPTAINPDFPHPSPPPPPNPHPMGPPLLPSHLGLGIDAQQYHHHTHFQMMHRRSQPLLQVQQPQQQELPQSGRLSIIMTDAPPEPHHQEEQDQRHEHEHHEQQEHEQQRQQQQQQQHPQYDADADPVPTRVGSPTQDEAKRGMETVMAYLDTQPPGVVAREGEYMALRRVMTRLALRTEAQEGAEGALSRGPQEQEHGQEQQYVQAETQA